MGAPSSVASRRNTVPVRQNNNPDDNKRTGIFHKNIQYVLSVIGDAYHTAFATRLVLAIPESHEKEVSVTTLKMDQLKL